MQICLEISVMVLYFPVVEYVILGLKWDKWTLNHDSMYLRYQQLY